MKKIIFIFLILFLSSNAKMYSETTVLSETFDKEANRGVSARSMAMGGAFVSDARDNPAYYNPAAFLNIKEFKLINRSYFGIKSDYNFSNLMMLQLEEGAFFAWNGNNNMQIGHQFIGGYAVPLNKIFSFGFTGKGIYRHNTVGLGCDAGFLTEIPLNASMFKKIFGLLSGYDVGSVPSTKDVSLNIGFTIHDLFTKVGEDLEPISIRLGAGFKPIKELEINFQSDLNANQNDTKDFFISVLRFGAEYVFPDDFFVIRGGFASLYPQESAITGGFGMNFKTVSLDYAYQGFWKDEFNTSNSHWLQFAFYFKPKTQEDVDKARKLKEEKNKLLLESAQKKIEKKEQEIKLKENKINDEDAKKIYKELDQLKKELENIKRELGFIGET